MSEIRNNSQATDQMSRYLSGEMDAAEMLGFEQRLLDDQDMNSEFIATKEAWELMAYYSAGSVTEINTDTAWEKLSSRIDEELTETPVVQFSRNYHLPVMLRWAAAVLVIAGIGWATYLGLTRKTDQPLLVFENTDQEMVSVKTLDDGSLVYLAQQSNISYPELFGTTERNVSITGEAFFDVAHDALKPFRIQAGNATIEVLGTSFNVKTNHPGILELFVETGRVKVWFDNSRQKSVMVNEGQLLMLKNGLAEVVSPSHYNTQWRRNLLQFRDENLGDILYALGKTYGFTFTTESDNLSNRMMTITIYDGSLETISEVIALSLSIDYEIKNDSMVVFRNRK